MTFLINIFFWLLSGLLKYQSSTEQSPPPSSPLFPCPNCGSHHTIKNGSIHNGKPKRQGKECGRQFVINPTNKTVSDETKQLIDKLLLERISLLGIARVTGVSWSWLQNYVNNKLAAVPRQIKVSDKPKGKLVIECDEMWSLVFSKTIKVLFGWQLIEIQEKLLVAMRGDRSRQSAKKLWDRPTRCLPTMRGCLHRLLGVL
jgi:transposase-like protein